MDGLQLKWLHSHESRLRDAQMLALTANTHDAGLRPYPQDINQRSNLHHLDGGWGRES